MIAFLVPFAVILAVAVVRRKLHRSGAAHRANIASMRPLAEFEARYPMYRRSSGRFMR